MMEHLAQIVMLLALAVAVVATFQRLHIPTSLGYLLVGVVVSPHTIGPIFYVPEFRVLAEFGVVFLLFTIGLNFSLPQLQALRHQVLGLGTGQVVFTTALVGFVVWLGGLPAVAAFVIGWMFAQSSTTIMGANWSSKKSTTTTMVGTPWPCPSSSISPPSRSWSSSRCSARPWRPMCLPRSRRPRTNRW